jgi:ribosomal protein L36
MKVHSSVKKRCEHCKVSEGSQKLRLLVKGETRAELILDRLSDGKPANDITDTCISSARRTLDTNNDKVNSE